MAVNYEDDDDLMEDLQVTLEIDGKSIETKPVTIYEMDGRDYILLAEADDEGDFRDDAELYIFRYYEDEDGEPSIEDIESEEEYRKASQTAEEILSELPEE